MKITLHGGFYLILRTTEEMEKKVSEHTSNVTSLVIQIFAMFNNVSQVMQNLCKNLQKVLTYLHILGTS